MVRSTLTRVYRGVVTRAGVLYQWIDLDEELFVIRSRGHSMLMVRQRRRCKCPMSTIKP